MQGGLALGHVVALVVVTASSTRAAPGEVEAEGRAPVIADNLVRARQRALDVALRTVLQVAVERRLSEEQRATPAARGLIAKVRNARSLVRGYRVLEQRRVGGAAMFVVRVAATIDNVRLGRSIAAVFPTKQERPESRGSCVLTIRGGPVETQQVRRWISSSLAAIGVKLADAGTGRGAGHLEVRIAYKPIEAVRGVGWAAGRAALDLVVMKSASSAARHRINNAAVGVGETKVAARRVAIERVIEKVAEPLRKTMRQLWPSKRTGTHADELVRVVELRSLAQFVAVCRALRQLTGQCRPRKLAAHSAELAVRGGARKVAQSLSQMTFTGFALEQMPAKGAAATLRVRLATQPPTSAPGQRSQPSGRQPSRTDHVGAGVER